MNKNGADNYDATLLPYKDKGKEKKKIRIRIRMTTAVTIMMHPTVSIRQKENTQMQIYKSDDDDNYDGMDDGEIYGRLIEMWCKFGIINLSYEDKDQNKDTDKYNNEYE